MKITLLLSVVICGGTDTILAGAKNRYAIYAKLPKSEMQI
jgi:hypothetical protein